MKDRIISFLNAEKLSPARFADIIGVQPANISHIISERNKPSLDFIQKMLKSFPQLNVEWLVAGTGKMYKTPTEQSLFNDESRDLFSSAPKLFDNEQNNYKIEETETEKIMKNDTETEKFMHKTDILPENEIKCVSREVERIIICYSDKTFEFYSPR
ncbi:MAG: helix-turn-helix domain-containing protein [Prevotellaceae bacterium]|jgi:transcriptional regulator with XRE-family HTH domain|nr:helix-turn-helix domain-containing protein [Prevotellaceae bacterium]